MNVNIKSTIKLKKLKSTIHPWGITCMSYFLKSQMDLKKCIEIPFAPEKIPNNIYFYNY